ncbi:inositol monophosphatase family protein [Demequina sp.]|uniref:inositol monophosphatase family protein n=1 Tax=Demequina sp. TaxID=2050685 RepID=UPI003D13B9C5
MPVVTQALSDAVLAAMNEATDAEVLPRWRSLGSDDVRTKAGPWDMVTDADVLAERRLTASLTELLDIPVVGEEATAADPSLLDLVAAAEACWVVDPVDGTRNFVHGQEDFACMVALIEGGRTQGAWITYPAVSREMHGALGVGCFVDGRRALAPEPADPSALRGALGARAFVADPEAVYAAAGSLGPVRDIRFCAGWDYLDMVEGLNKDYVLFTRTLPWDHAPGSLLVREAGLASLRPDGSEYLPGDGRPGLLTAHPSVWERVARALLPAL